MIGLLAAEFAKLLKRKLALNFADIFAHPVVVALAHCTLQTNEIWLGHNGKCKMKKLKCKIIKKSLCDSLYFYILLCHFAFLFLIFAFLQADGRN